MYQMAQGRFAISNNLTAKATPGRRNSEVEGNRRGQDATSEGWRNSSKKQPLFGRRLWHSGEVSMAKRKLRNNEAPIDELENDSGQAASDSAGQSGDDQGLSEIAEADEESIEELAEADQAYEAEAVEGVEDAGDHPERPVRTREDKAR
jgi:hypothetical protein